MGRPSLQREKPDKPPATVGIRVVIIEDQRLIADFFSLHCQAIGLKVAAIAVTLADGLAAVRQHSPELLLLDFSLPDGSGLEAAKILQKDFPAMRILGISSHRDPWTLLQVQRLGLHGFVDKHDQRPDVLTEAIKAVLAGRTFYTPVVSETANTMRRDPHAFIRVLSDYEIQILSLIGESKSDDEIAAQLGITAATMQSRRRDIMRKLDVHTTPKLIHFAIVNGLTRPEQLSQRPP
ncbi:MAG: response regulator transcription factor [Opitutae bacterium]|nr:response regulator transcription factor [Opitutae bacterium]